MDETIMMDDDCVTTVGFHFQLFCSFSFIFIIIHLMELLVAGREAITNCQC